MFDLTPLVEFSRLHCTAICATLVPLNLLLTTQTLLLAFLGRSRWQVQLAATTAIAVSIAMVLHVLTWLIIGVVMAPTFILVAIASLCMVENSFTWVAPKTVGRWLRFLDRIEFLRQQRLHTNQGPRAT